MKHLFQFVDAPVGLLDASFDLHDPAAVFCKRLVHRSHVYADLGDAVTDAVKLCLCASFLGSIHASVLPSIEDHGEKRKPQRNQGDDLSC